MIYEISKKANEDINSIWLYTFENWSQDQADRYYNLILDEIEYVADNFETGKSINHLRKGYFKTKVKSHIIFYKKTKKDTIEIIRVLHQMMDIDNRLSE
jgi:toxin ParE1/3/4